MRDFMQGKDFTVIVAVRFFAVVLNLVSAIFALTLNALRGKWKMFLLDLGIFFVRPLLWSISGNILRLCFPDHPGLWRPWLYAGLPLWVLPHCLLAVRARRRKDRDGLFCAAAGVLAVISFEVWQLLTVMR